MNENITYVVTAVRQRAPSHSVGAALDSDDRGRVRWTKEVAAIAMVMMIMMVAMMMMMMKMIMMMVMVRMIG